LRERALEALLSLFLVALLVGTLAVLVRGHLYARKCPTRRRVKRRSDL
jgi:hypothetical protein